MTPHEKYLDNSAVVQGNDKVISRKHGSLEYVAQQGENGSVPTYQEASGAPVEVRNPLGYQVQWFTIIFLNIGQMVGTGVFSTREWNTS
jgi:hypothetical protein